MNPPKTGQSGQVKSNFAPYKIDGVTVTLRGPQSVVSNGKHTVTEQENANYDVTYSPNCALGVITVAAGKSKTCTIINTYNPGTIKVEKTIVDPTKTGPFGQVKIKL